MKASERDFLRKTILELLAKGHVHYTDICKKAIGTCQEFITSNTVPNEFYGYLMKNGFIERVGPKGAGIYKLTEKGRKLLDALT